MLSRVGQQRHLARALHGQRDGALVLRARADLAARLELAAVRDVAAQHRDVLVVGLVDLVDAEGTATAPCAEATSASIIAVVPRATVFTWASVEATCLG